MGHRGALVDPHGCVTKNCEEGVPCPNGYRCDPASSFGDVNGCVAPTEPPNTGGGGSSGTAGTAGTAGTGGTVGTAGTGGTSGVGGATADTGVCR
jgi:hypothetical protein